MLGRKKRFTDLYRQIVKQIKDRMTLVKFILENRKSCNNYFEGKTIEEERKNK